MAIRKGMGQKKVKMIAKRFGISLEDAKRFYFDRKKEKLEGRRLPFYKWKKRNLDVSQTKEGNDVEQGDFDNFFSRKRRRKIARRLRRVGGRLRPKNVLGALGRGISDLKKRRAIKIRRHKNLLRKMADPRFMANPRNVLKIRDRVKNMAKGIARTDKRIIRRANKMRSGGFMGGMFGDRGLMPRTPNKRYPNRRRPIGRPNPYYVGFEGEDYSDSTFLNASGGGFMDKLKKNKWLVLAGVGAFLFLTPMGKKLIK